MRRALGALLLLLASCAQEQPEVARQPAQPPPLPPAGVVFAALPDGDGASIADQRCLTCHSSDLLRQQRLTEAQWTAVVDKMARWGSGMREDERTPLIAYLAHHFGPQNRYAPIETLPVAE